MTKFYYEKDATRSPAALKELHAATGVRALEHDLMSKLGPGMRQGQRSTYGAMHQTCVVFTC